MSNKADLSPDIAVLFGLLRALGLQSVSVSTWKPEQKDARGPLPERSDLAKDLIDLIDRRGRPVEHQYLLRLLAESIDTRGIVPVVDALHAVRYPDCVNGAEPSPPHGTVDGDMLNGFDIALQKLRDGYGVRRRGWNGAGLTVRMQVPDAHSKMTLPYLYIEYPATHPVTPGARCPWLASQTDMCATDWELVVP